MADYICEGLEDAHHRTLVPIFDKGSILAAGAAKDPNAGPEPGDVVIGSGAVDPEVPEAIFAPPNHCDEDFGPEGDPRWSPQAGPPEVIGGDGAVSGKAAF